MILGRTRLVEKAEGDSKLTFANLARLAVRRLLATFRSRIPMYVNALRAGKLKLSTLRRQATLLQASNDLFQQIEEETKRIGTSQPVTQSDTDSSEEPQPQLF
jgi:hypothetical protein